MTDLLSFFLLRLLSEDVHYLSFAVNVVLVRKVNQLLNAALRRGTDAQYGEDRKRITFPRSALLLLHPWSLNELNL